MKRSICHVHPYPPLPHTHKAEQTCYQCTAAAFVCANDHVVCWKYRETFWHLWQAVYPHRPVVSRLVLGHGDTLLKPLVPPITPRSINAVSLCVVPSPNPPSRQSIPRLLSCVQSTGDGKRSMRTALAPTHTIWCRSVNTVGWLLGRALG